jgi:hypothetical protein
MARRTLAWVRRLQSDFDPERNALVGRVMLQSEPS